MLALVTEAYGGRGGIAQYNRDLFAAIGGGTSLFSSIDVLPRLAVNDAPVPLPTVRQLHASSGRALYSARALYHAAAKRPLVVFCGHLFMAPLAWAAARLAKARLVIQLHGIEIWKQPSPAQRLALEAADLVTCVSRHTRMWACSWAAIAPERVSVISNTVAQDFTPGDRNSARRRFGLRDDEFALLSVGRLDSRERYKGHDQVIDELARLPVPHGRRLQYLIAGDGDDRARLEARAKTAPANCVRFLGHIDRTELPDLYRAADLFVLPSRGEGFGIVFLEAMACGTPAIGLAAGGAPDALGDGELGRCVAPDKFPEALAQAIAAPRTDPHALAARVRDRFGDEVFRARVARTFARLQA